MINLFKYFFIINIIYCSCPEIIDSQVLYEDDCGDCWLPYCYDYVTHEIIYDTTDDLCDGVTSTWVIPGDPGDPFFNNYCDSCPDGFYEDDCSDCWMEYCYDFDIHLPYYDMTESDCLSNGLVWVVPGENMGDPYWNSSCDEVECFDGEVADCEGNCGGYAMVDDCGLCQSAYCYDYVTHEVSFDLPCEGATVMLVMPDDPSNPYWNATCTDCNEEVNGNAMIDDCGDCELPYCYDYVTHEVSYDFPCEGETQIEVMPDNLENPYWDEDCSECDLIGDINGDNALNVIDIVGIVEAILSDDIPEIILCADINNDGTINIIDIVALVGIILGES